MTPQKVLKSMDDLCPLITGLIEDGTDVTLTVTGNSMSPLWHHLQNSVVLTKCDPKKLKKGDVPLYKRADGHYVLHRIVKVNDNSFDLAGDAQTLIEYGLEKFRVIAVTKAFYRNNKLIECNNWRYKTYETFWRLVFPFRPCFLRINRVLCGKKNEQK